MNRTNGKHNRLGTIPATAVIGLGLGAVAVFLSTFFLSVPEDSGRKKAISSASLKKSERQNDKLFPVNIRKPNGQPTITIKTAGPAGTSAPDSHASVKVRCSQCHTTRKPNFQNRSTEQLDEFHKKMSFSHGNLTCLSCHNAKDYDSLQLASGEKLEFSNVMKLCSQCHSSQARDFQHGAHGGMTGYWDRSKGPQNKNNCIDCHNPHGPKFPKMKPTFKPKDRFLDASH